MINKNIAGKTASFDGFAGMDSSTPFGSESTYGLKNFRLLADGSLEKREGYRHLATLSDAARGRYLLREGGESALLVAAGSELYRIPLGEGEAEHASVFSRTEGQVIFLPMEDALYLLDGDRLYRYDGGVSLTAGEAYVPMGGKGWQPNSWEKEKPDEMPNLLSGLLRYEYEPDEEISFLNFGIPVDEVISFDLEQYSMPSYLYSLTEDRRGIRLAQATEGRGRSVYVTVRVSHAENLLGTHGRFVCEDGTLLLYGGREGRVYASRRPEGEGTGFPVYFPSDAVWQVGGGVVQSLCRVGKQLMIFSEDGLRLTREEVVSGKTPSVATLTTSIGCSAPDGAVALDEDKFLVVGGGGVYRVQVDPSLERECSWERVSRPVDRAFGKAFLTGASVCRHPAMSEVWFADPSGAGEVFIYRPEDKLWYVFGEVRADALLECGGRMLFLEGQFLNRFEEELVQDRASYGTLDIEARFRSGYFDFGAPESDKRLSGLLLLASLDGGAVEVRLSDGGYVAELTVEGASHPTFPYLYERTLKSGRFRFASLELRAAGAAKQRIFGAKVFV